MDILSYGSGSSGNCTVITPHIMVDAGINPRKIPQEVMRKVDFCLITHEHGDHSRYIKAIRNYGIDVYATTGTLKKLKIKPDYRFHVVKGEFKVKDWNILPFESFHDAVEPVNYLLQKDGLKIIYITDTSKAVCVVKGLTHIIIEANYDSDMLNKNLAEKVVSPILYTRVSVNHLCIRQTIDFLKLNDLSKVRKIYLAHISRNNGKPKQFVEAIQKLTGIETEILGGIK